MVEFQTLLQVVREAFESVGEESSFLGAPQENHHPVAQSVGDWQPSQRHKQLHGNYWSWEKKMYQSVVGEKRPLVLSRGSPTKARTGLRSSRLRQPATTPRVECFWKFPSHCLPALITLGGFHL